MIKLYLLGGYRFLFLSTLGPLHSAGPLHQITISYKLRLYTPALQLYGLQLARFRLSISFWGLWIGGALNVRFTATRRKLPIIVFWQLAQGVSLHTPHIQQICITLGLFRLGALLIGSLIQKKNSSYVVCVQNFICFTQYFSGRLTQVRGFGQHSFIGSLTVRIYRYYFERYR